MQKVLHSFLTYDTCFTDLDHLDNIEILESKLHSITCDNCHLIDLYENDQVLLEYLSKDEILMLHFNAIHIRLQDMKHIISFENDSSEISQCYRVYLEPRV